MKITFSLFLSWIGISAAGAPMKFIDWSSLHNPILSYSNWSIKDSAMAYRDGTFYVFFSAFYDDHGRVRSHVVEVSTRDFKTFSEPIFDFDGEEDGWIGMCSPDVQKLGHTWELSFNSWGDDPQKPDQLFYMISSDLVHWSPRHPLAAELTKGEGVIDLSVTRDGDNYFAMWKSGRVQNSMRPRMATAKSLRGRWSFVGSGFPALKMADGNDNGLTHENFEFLKLDGRWRILSSDYPQGHHEYLYTQARPGNWLDWGEGIGMHFPAQDFNTLVHADAAALYDWRKLDGYFYMLYAGRTEQTTYLHRGWNRLALARSKDLKHWMVAGETN